jgi:outer membrane protein
MSVNRMCKWILSVALPLGLTAGAVVPAGAQNAAPPANGRHIAELIANARERYDQAVKQGAPTAPTAARTPERMAIKLSVDDAVTRALQNNIELSIERLNPTLQDLYLEQLRAAYGVTFTSSAGMTSNMPLPTTSLAGGTRVKNETLTFNNSVTQSLPWNGASYAFSFNNSRVDTTNSYALLNPQYTPTITATLTQPLWRNRSIDSTRRTLRTAEISKQITDTTLRARVINVEANTRNAYWDYVNAIRSVEVARQSLSLAEKLVADNRIRVEVGTLAPMDIVEAQAEEATRRQALASTEANRHTTELVLKRLLVGSTGDPLWNAVIDPTSIVQVEPRTVDLEKALTSALESRTDLTNARRQIQSNDITIRYLKNQMSPGLDATLTYGTRGLAGNTSTTQGGWTDAMDMLRKFDYPTWTVAVTFSYPLGKSAQEASYARARVQYQQAQAQVRALELQVATDVTNAAVNIESTQRTLEAARAARVLAERKLEAEQSKFDVGMQTNFFVVQAQRDLLDAQLTELGASLSYQKALVEFERVQVTTTSSTSVTTVSSSGSSSTTSSSSGN